MVTMKVALNPLTHLIHWVTSHTLMTQIIRLVVFRWSFNQCWTFQECTHPIAIGLDLEETMHTLIYIDEVSIWNEAFTWQ